MSRPATVAWVLRRALPLVILAVAVASCSGGQTPSATTVPTPSDTTVPTPTGATSAATSSATSAATSGITTGAGSSGPSDAPTGTVYYSQADALMRYEFGSRTESVVFEGGDSFTVSVAQGKFAWAENNFFANTSRVHVHELATPSNVTTLELAVLLESAPEFAPGADQFGALARSTDSPDTRTDLLLFDEQGATIGRIPHVKDFSFSPDGQDVLVSAEALDGDGTAIGWALAVVEDVHGGDQRTVTIAEFSDYGQLPTDLAVAPNSTQAVFTHAEHLHIVALRESATPHQVTESRFNEVDAAWSPDGQQLIFVATGEGDFDLGCGELRIAPAHPAAPVPVPANAWDNAPADPTQPVDVQGKAIHACDSPSMYWVG